MSQTAAQARRHVAPAQVKCLYAAGSTSERARTKAWTNVNAATRGRGLEPRRSVRRCDEVHLCRRAERLTERLI
eukprot:262404-Heterocapsa_arctica.AAC.1